MSLRLSLFFLQSVSGWSQYDVKHLLTYMPALLFTRSRAVVSWHTNVVVDISQTFGLSKHCGHSQDNESHVQAQP